MDVESLPNTEVLKGRIAEPGADGSIVFLIGSVLGLYLFAYLVLLTLGYFELAALPWSQHEHDCLVQLFEPMEWLRRLWG